MVILRATIKDSIRSKVDYEQFEELQDIDYTGDRTGKFTMKMCNRNIYSEDRVKF